MQILHAFAKALMFFGTQATVLIGVILAIRWNARRKERQAVTPPAAAADGRPDNG